MQTDMNLPWTAVKMRKNRHDCELKMFSLNSKSHTYPKKRITHIYNKNRQE